jgi:hypothetical protein
VVQRVHSGEKTVGAGFRVFLSQFNEIDSIKLTFFTRKAYIFVHQFGVSLPRYITPILPRLFTPSQFGVGGTPNLDPVLTPSCLPRLEDLTCLGGGVPDKADSLTVRGTVCSAGGLEFDPLHIPFGGLFSFCMPMFFSRICKQAAEPTARPHAEARVERERSFESSILCVFLLLTCSLLRSISYRPAKRKQKEKRPPKGTCRGSNSRPPAGQTVPLTVRLSALSGNPPKHVKSSSLGRQLHVLCESNRLTQHQ